MVDTQNPTSVGGGTMARRLAAAGFRGTPIVRAVVELVGSYLGMDPDISSSLTRALSTTNQGAMAVMPDRPALEPALTAAVSSQPIKTETATGVAA